MNATIEQFPGESRGYTMVELPVTGPASSGAVEPLPPPNSWPPLLDRLRRLRAAVMRRASNLARRLASRVAMRVVVARQRVALRASRYQPPPRAQLLDCLTVAPGAPALPLAA